MNDAASCVKQPAHCQVRASVIVILLKMCLLSKFYNFTKLRKIVSLIESLTFQLVNDESTRHQSILSNKTESIIQGKCRVTYSKTFDLSRTEKKITYASDQ